MYNLFRRLLAYEPTAELQKHNEKSNEIIQQKTNNKKTRNARQPCPVSAASPQLAVLLSLAPAC